VIVSAKEYAKRYKNLALENVSHFLHGGTALATWRTMHRKAIVAAGGTPKLHDCAERAAVAVSRQSGDRDHALLRAAIADG
jgi:hypothetical protein